VQEVEINNIVTIHYFEYMKDFSFPGEAHDFWEFLYVDKGEVDIIADTRKFTLQKGQIVFHKPNEFHALHANGIVAPNLVVISFYCTSPSIDYFIDQILHINDFERSLIGNIIREAKSSYSSPLNDPTLKMLERNSDIPFGSEQIIKINLEYLLINLIRRYHSVDCEVTKNTIQMKTTKMNYDDELINQVIDYMEASLLCHLTIEQICKEYSVGRSQLQNLFQQKFQCGVIEYFSIIKIETAKKYIRETHMNFTQIAEKLGYSSVHYFSRQFKKISGMSPSQYSSSVKSLSEKSFL
jgi:AraC-like DNA-binding protein